jgi:hypothetical protein
MRIFYFKFKTHKLNAEVEDLNKKLSAAKEEFIKLSNDSKNQVHFYFKLSIFFVNLNLTCK